MLLQFILSSLIIKSFIFDWFKLLLLVLILFSTEITEKNSGEDICILWFNLFDTLVFMFNSKESFVSFFL